MINIKPIQIGFPIKKAIKINIRVGSFSTDAVICPVFWELLSEKEDVLANGNIRLTEEQFNQWASDNSYIDNIVLTQLGLERNE
jgi:hypothetical protein